MDRATQMRVAESKLSLLGDGSELVVDSNGDLEVILEANPQSQNSLRLPPGANSLLIREMYYDWETEEASHLSIERIGASYPAPPSTAQALDQAMDRMCSFLTRQPVARRSRPDTKLRRRSGHAVVRPHGQILRPRLRRPGLWVRPVLLRPRRGRHRDGAAAGVHLLGLPIGSQYFESYDWPVRQTSINGHQALLDRDGCSAW